MFHEFHFPALCYHLTCLPARFGNCRFPLATGAAVIGPVAKDLLGETYPSKMDAFWEGDAVWLYLRCIRSGLYKGHKTMNSRKGKKNTTHLD